jgi:hypothetical protein
MIGLVADTLDLCPVNSSASSQANRDPDGEQPDLGARLDAMHRSELERWARVVSESQLWYDEIEAMRKTVSWRVTAPLRVFRAKRLRG